MTERQRIFAREYVACGNGCESYRRAYPRSKNWRLANINARASKLRAMLLPYIEELRAKATSAKVLTKAQALEMVTGIAQRAVAESPKTALAAVERLAKMQAWDAPTQVDLADVTKRDEMREAFKAMGPEQLAAYIAEHGG